MLRIDSDRPSAMYTTAVRPRACTDNMWVDRSELMNIAFVNCCNVSSVCAFRLSSRYETPDRLPTFCDVIRAGQDVDEDLAMVC